MERKDIEKIEDIVMEHSHEEYTQGGQAFIVTDTDAVMMALAGLKNNPPRTKFIN